MAVSVADFVMVDGFLVGCFNNTTLAHQMRAKRAPSTTSP
jgi:hypothetical protein